MGRDRLEEFQVAPTYAHEITISSSKQEQSYRHVFTSSIYDWIIEIINFICFKYTCPESKASVRITLLKDLIIIREKSYQASIDSARKT